MLEAKSGTDQSALGIRSNTSQAEETADGPKGRKPPGLGSCNGVWGRGHDAANIKTPKPSRSSPGSVFKLSWRLKIQHI